MVLETDRLLFRQHLREDIDEFLEMESDSEYRWPQPVHPREEILQSFQSAWLPPKEMGLMATVYKPDSRYIGRCGLYPFRNELGETVAEEAVLAFYLARPYRGRGLATEAGRFFIQHGFETLGLTKIHAGANQLNLRSNRVIQKLGFRLVRSEEGGGSKWHDYELDASDVPSGR